ncbi:MAG TPA: hypothetical protein VKA95_06430 [Nitrososphaeraceae archaeon]|nr:hypothetical protein [Nitrososphaeraceae archaeon]
MEKKTKDGLPSKAYFYVSNGSFIKTANDLGYEWKPTHRGSPNVYFKMKISKNRSKPFTTWSFEE